MCKPLQGADCRRASVKGNQDVYLSFGLKMLWYCQKRGARMTEYPLYRIPWFMFGLKVEMRTHPHNHQVVINRVMENLLAWRSLKLSFTVGNALFLTFFPELSQ